jgi:hypothetical protein
MSKINLQRLGMLVVAALGIVMMTGCADMGKTGVYRSYYQDRECRIYYVDGLGNRVYEWNAKPVDLEQFKRAHVGMQGYSDAVYVDSMGNQIFADRICQ